MAQKCVVVFSNFGKLLRCNMAQNEQKIRSKVFSKLLQTLALKYCSKIKSILDKNVLLFFKLWQTLPLKYSSEMRFFFQSNYGIVIWLKMSEK